MKLPFASKPSASMAACLLVVPLVLAACSSNGSASPGSVATSSKMPTGSTVTIGEVGAFTGDSSFEGAELANGCLPATLLINGAGGVLGHPLNCSQVDTRGDAVDALPAVEKLLATTSDLGGVLGPGTSDAPVDEPLFARSKLTMIADTGSPQYDKTADPYFWRLTPADDTAGKALTYFAKTKGYTTVALVFTNDASAQSNVPPATAAAQKLGVHIASNLTLVPNQSSYRTEVQSLVQAHPQAILMEGDPQSDSTFFRELKEAGGLVPIIGTAITEDPTWIKAVGAAIGPSTLARYYTAVVPFAPQSGSGWTTFDKALVAAKKKGQGTQPGTYASDVYAMTSYDGTNLMALAMLKSKSTVPATYNATIASLVKPSPGAVVVSDFADGKKALDAGKTIQYVGAAGPIVWNHYHNVVGIFEVVKVDATGAFVNTGSLPQQALLNLQSS
jgi:ABC-type branched-subunit amino acid transport system substrate-binding protein